MVHNTQNRTGKLDLNNVSSGIFLGFTGTKKNVWFKDEHTGRVKVGSFIEFDEAHMSVPAQKAPLAAQALQRVGYYINEPENDTPVLLKDKLTVKLLTKSVKYPRQLSGGPIALTMDSDSPITIQPKETTLIQTGLSISAKYHKYLELTPNQSTIHPHLHALPGYIASSETDEIFVVVSNSSKHEVIVPPDMELAYVQPPQTKPFTMEVQSYREHKMKTRSRVIHSASETNENDSSLPNNRGNRETVHMQLFLDMPFDIVLSKDPYDFHCHREVSLLNTKHKTLGMKIKQCSKRNKPILEACLPGTPSAKLPHWREHLKQAYVTAINDVPVKNENDIVQAIQAARQFQLKNIKVSFATMHRQALHPQHGVPQLYHDQLGILAHHIFDIQHEQPLTHQIHRIVMEDTQQHLFYINQLIINKLKKKFNTFTLRQLKQREDWNDWNLSIFKQLNQYCDQDTFDDPQPLPPGANLLSLCWVYLIKTDGTKKARCVCNGSPRFRGTVTLAETYASALDQVGARVFWATAALNNYIVIGSDASNAFAEAPPPKAPLYVRIDENYKRWYKDKYPERPALPDDYVLKVKKALQGHPESPRLWATLIDRLLKKLNLKPCTHEPNLYYTNNYNNTGKTVLFLRQVDDLAIACQDKELADMVIQNINDKMSIEIKHLGEISRYNGVDIDQRREYIKIHNATYISKLEHQHKWLAEDTTPIHSHPLPMESTSSYLHQLEQATPLTATEKTAIENKYGFTYRQGVGEIIYAMITCRPDISFGIIKLSQYSTRPAEIHYKALQHMYRYLKHTKYHGIYYWRSEPRDDLKKGDIPVLYNANNYNEAEVSERMTVKKDELMTYVDSDHAADTTHRKSVSGYHCKLAGGVVLYKTQLQSIVAQSSTEAEFIAAAEAGKNILYLRTILSEIGIPQHQASVLFEDNQGALLMGQAGQPTKRTKHIDVKHFAIQSWVERDLITFRRINTSDNSADALTKATPRTLFYRHNNHIMGRIIPEYVKFVSQQDKVIPTTYSNNHQIKLLALNIFTAQDCTHSSVQGGMLPGDCIPSRNGRSVRFSVKHCSG